MERSLAFCEYLPPGRNVIPCGKQWASLYSVTWEGHSRPECLGFMLDLLQVMLLHKMKTQLVSPRAHFSHEHMRQLQRDWLLLGLWLEVFIIQG